jgi:hypothetical protein
MALYVVFDDAIRKSLILGTFCIMSRGMIASMLLVTQSEWRVISMNLFHMMKYKRNRMTM